MFMPSHSGADKRSDIKLDAHDLGITAERITLKEYNEYVPQIRALHYNVLDTSKNQMHGEGSLESRKHVLNEVHQGLLGLTDTDVLFVAKQNNKVVGFIAIKKQDESSGRVARVKEMWVSKAEQSQKPVIGQLLDRALHEVQNGEFKDYPRLHINAPNASHDFEVVCANPERGRHLVVEHERDKHGSENIEKKG